MLRAVAPAAGRQPARLPQDALGQWVYSHIRPALRHDVPLYNVVWVSHAEEVYAVVADQLTIIMLRVSAASL